MKPVLQFNDILSRAMPHILGAERAVLWIHGPCKSGNTTLAKALFDQTAFSLVVLNASATSQAALSRMLTGGTPVLINDVMRQDMVKQPLLSWQSRSYQITGGDKPSHQSVLFHAQCVAVTSEQPPTDAQLRARCMVIRCGYRRHWKNWFRYGFTAEIETGPVVHHL